MPLTSLQKMVASVLRPFRTQHNYIAGGAALNREWPRLSDDLDIFHDQRDQLPESVEPELQALRDAGFAVEITTRDQSIVEAILRRYGSETRVQWFDDPEICNRFFPALEDDELGFRLHPADIAVNKVLCTSRRAAPRDAVDLANIVNRYSPLGPLIWAVTGKKSDLNPLQVIRDIRSTVFGHSEEEIIAVRMEGEQRPTRNDLHTVLAQALDTAHDYCSEVAPIKYDGCLFIDANEMPIEADEKAIADGVAKAISLKDFGLVPAIGV